MTFKTKKLETESDIERALNNTLQIIIKYDMKCMYQREESTCILSNESWHGSKAEGLEWIYKLQQNKMQEQILPIYDSL